MKFHIITTFPEAFASYLDTSVLGRAQKAGLVSVRFYNPRDFTEDKHHKTDDRPYGGGPGMVMIAQPILDAVEAIKSKVESKKLKVIITSATGKQFTNGTARTWSKRHTDIIIIAGHYEGIDARVKKILKAEEVSIGPYILTGGELPAMAIIDAVCRQVPGALGNEESLEEDRVSTTETYTRPEILEYKGKNYRVPKVLLSGHHKDIEKWKKQKNSKK